MNCNNMKLLLFITILPLLLTGCQSEGPPAMAPAGPIEVDVMTVSAEPVELATELPGRTTAYRVAEVRPQVSGIIQERLFTEGSEVAAGELLYQIDPATYQAAFDSATATLAKAEVIEHSTRLKAERYRTLVQTKAVSEQEQIEVEAAWQQARAEVAAARAALASARINLDYTRVTAPISGRIGKSMISEGALVTAQQGMALAVIQQLDPIYVDVSQSSTDLLRLRREIAAGRTVTETEGRADVTVILDDGSIYQHGGYLEFSDVTVDESTGTVTLRAIVNNPDQELLPGMFVRARIAKGTRPEAVLVPAATIIRNPRGQATVLVVDDANQVESRVVETSQNIGDRVLVDAGLTVGEKIIVAGIQKVRAGATVNPIEQPLRQEPQASAQSAVSTTATTE